MTTPPTLMEPVMKPGSAGKARGSAPTTYIIVYWISSETPMAVIRAARRVELRRGRYATRSITTPRVMQSSMASSSDSKNPSPSTDMLK